MNKLNSILAGVDFSDASRSALEQAARLAQRRQARLHALHVVEHLILNDVAWQSHLSPAELEQEAVCRARQELERWMEQSGAGPEGHVAVEVGSPLERLLDRLGQTGAELLVLGLNGSSMLPQGAGTLATRSLRRAPTKVLLVHERQRGPFRRIVAALDFTEASREVAAQAMAVAAPERSETHFVHVFTGSWGRHALVPDAWEVDPVKAAHYRQALDRQLREFVGDTSGLPCHFAVLEAGSHGHGLAEYARQIHADLLVVGTGKHGPLGQVLVGSTVERLLREIPCSVLAVRPRSVPPSSPAPVR